jgi:uncharacterized membrane protein required for colicin V production
VEYLAAAAVLRGFYVGYRSGFFPELLRIAAYLLTVIVTLYFHPSFTEMITLHTFLNQGTANVVSFATLFFGLLLVTKLITMLFVKVLKPGEGGAANRLSGLAIGGCRWLILLSLVFMLIEYSPLEVIRKDIASRSVVGPPVASIAPTIFDFLSNLSPQLAIKK